MRTPHDQADESVPGPKGQGSAELRELARGLNGLFQELGCSLRSFADRVHRNPGAVSRYVRGGRMPPEDFIRVLLHEVGIARGGQVTSGEAERIAVLHRRALQRADGTSARIQLLHLDHAAAQTRAQAAEAALNAATAAQQAPSGPHRSAFADTVVSWGWSAQARAALDAVSTRVVACLPDPAGPTPQQTSGVVVVGAQSGKTAYGTGVIARAMDAGYRMVIVLSGIHNLMRTQTQKRLEEALLPPAVVPAPGENRLPVLSLTSPESDYRRLPDPAALAFEKHDPSLPLYQPPNLHSSRTRLLVIKQNVSILSRLQDDLRQAGPALSEVPTLIVDFDPAPCGISGLSRDGASVSRTRIDDLRAQLTDLLSRSQVIVFREHVTLGSSAREEGPGALSLWGSHPDFVIPTPRSHFG